MSAFSVVSLNVCAGGGDGFVSRFLYACAFECRYGYSRAAEGAAELRKVDLVAIFIHNVHHVYRDNDGYAELRKLRREVEVPFKVCAVNDV